MILTFPACSPRTVAEELDCGEKDYCFDLDFFDAEHDSNSEVLYSIDARGSGERYTLLTFASTYPIYSRQLVPILKVRPDPVLYLPMPMTSSIVQPLVRS